MSISSLQMHNAIGINLTLMVNDNIETSLAGVTGKQKAISQYIYSENCVILQSWIHINDHEIIKST